MDISKHQKILIHQIFEGWELLGFETRNKYVILDQNSQKIGFAAEQQKGFLGFIMRQFVGHWRSFQIHFYDENRQQFMVATHPFNIFFQSLTVVDSHGKKLGSLQQKFSFFAKKFDVMNSEGKIIMQMSSPFWKLWSFPFTSHNKERARISKKWSGALAELFTDKDHFLVEYKDTELGDTEKKIILAASVFIDLQYFEQKAD